MSVAKQEINLSGNVDSYPSWNNEIHKRLKLKHYLDDVDTRLINRELIKEMNEDYNDRYNPPKYPAGTNLNTIVEEMKLQEKLKGTPYDQTQKSKFYGVANEAVPALREAMKKSEHKESSQMAEEEKLSHLYASKMNQQDKAKVEDALDDIIIQIEREHEKSLNMDNREKLMQAVKDFNLKTEQDNLLNITEYLEEKAAPRLAVPQAQQKNLTEKKSWADLEEEEEEKLKAPYSAEEISEAQIRKKPTSRSIFNTISGFINSQPGTEINLKDDITIYKTETGGLKYWDTDKKKLLVLNANVKKPILTKILGAIDNSPKKYEETKMDLGKDIYNLLNNKKINDYDVINKSDNHYYKIHTFQDGGIQIYKHGSYGSLQPIYNPSLGLLKNIKMVLSERFPHSATGFKSQKKNTSWFKNRFNVLKGEIECGNDNPAVIKEITEISKILYSKGLLNSHL